MRLPRDIGGGDLSRRLSRYGYGVVRQTGGHLKLTSNHTGREHSITIPNQPLLRLDTLSNILVEVAVYLGISKEDLAVALFV